MCLKSFIDTVTNASQVSRIPLLTGIQGYKHGRGTTCMLNAHFPKSVEGHGMVKTLPP